MAASRKPDDIERTNPELIEPDEHKVVVVRDNLRGSSIHCKHCTLQFDGYVAVDLEEWR